MQVIAARFRAGLSNALPKQVLWTTCRRLSPASMACSSRRAGAASCLIGPRRLAELQVAELG